MIRFPPRSVLLVAVLSTFGLAFVGAAGCITAECQAEILCDEGDVELDEDADCPDGDTCYEREGCGQEIVCVDLGEKHTGI